MEEKGSPFSGSPGVSETESPPALMTEMAPKVVSVDGENSFLPSTTTKSTMVTSGGGGSVSGDFLGKKKRGRPRKYDSDGNLSLAYQKIASPDGFSLSPTSPSEFSSKKGRGRPSGSRNWQLLASLGELFANTAGGDFTPHIVTVKTGEDVAGKILSFSQKGPRGICVLSANGAVSNVTIHQPGSSGGILTYEGRFEILSLSGSFTVTDSCGMTSRTGGLSVSLAGPDGRVIGGGIAGLLVAASPIQIVVGSFVLNDFKMHKRKYRREYAVSSADRAAPETRPIPQDKPENKIRSSPLMGQTNGEVDGCESEKHNLNFPSENTAWTISPSSSDQRISPDINISVPFGE